MSFWEPSNPIKAGQEYSKIAEVQIKDIKIDFLKMREVLKNE